MMVNLVNTEMQIRILDGKQKTVDFMSIIAVDYKNIFSKKNLLTITYGPTDQSIVI